MQKYLFHILAWALLIVGTTSNVSAQGWLKRYAKQGENASANAVAQTADGGYFSCGVANTANGSRIYLVKTDPEGDTLMTRSIPTSALIRGTLHMTAVGDGSFLIAFAVSESPNPRNIQLWNVSPNGKATLLNSFGDAADEYVGDIIRLSDNNFAILATKYGNNGDSAAILKTDRLGSLIWQSNIPLTSLRRGEIRATALQESQNQYALYFSTSKASGSTARLFKLNRQTGAFIQSYAVPSFGSNSDSVLVNVERMLTLPNGDLAVLGNYFMQIDSTAQIRWYGRQKFYASLPSVLNRSANGVFTIVATDSLPFNISAYRQLYQRFSATGTLILDKLVGTFDPLITERIYLHYDLWQNADGSQVLASEETIGGGSKGRLMKIDADGTWHTNEIKGYAFIDVDADCILGGLGSNDIGYLNTTIEAVSRSNPAKVYRTRPVDSTGYFSLTVDSGIYDVRLLNIDDKIWATSCAGFASFSSDYGQSTQLMGMQMKVNCPQLEVNLTTVYLRRCETSKYQVRIRNNGTGLARNAYVEITLDSLLNFQNASLPLISQNGRTFRFNLGNVTAGKGSSFDLFVQPACNNSTKIDQNLAVSARVFPDSFCVKNINWSKADIRVEANCTPNNGVELKINNAGSGGASFQSQNRNIVIEDEIILLQTLPTNLPGGQTITLPQIKNGRTYRLVVPQVVNHPSRATTQTIAIEGCGTNGQGDFSRGMVNQFAESDHDPFVDREAQILRGGLVGTELNALPIGYREQRFIDASDDIEYQVNFRNTTSDTAAIVTVRDTLSDFLDVNTVEIGSSSHPYSYQVFGKIIKFAFPTANLLPNVVDSTRSFGYVKYRVRLNKNIPAGTRIFNRSYVNMDFVKNQVPTNQTFHTVGKDFVITAIIDKPLRPTLAQIKIYPNPFSEKAIFEVENYPLSNLKFSLYDLAGKLLRIEYVIDNRLEFARQNLPVGLYVFKMENDKGQLVGTGKLMVSQ